MEILGTKTFIPKGFELGTTLSYPNWSIAATRKRIQERQKFTDLAIKVSIVIRFVRALFNF